MRKFGEVADNFLGGMNFFEKIFGLIHQARMPSKGGRFGKLVRIDVPRVDHDGEVPSAQIRNHLIAHGVRLFHYGYNSHYQWFYVRKTQEKFARWLYNEQIQEFRFPKSRWGEQNARQDKKPRRPPRRDTDLQRKRPQRPRKDWRSGR